MIPVERVFLDANVLFSAARSPASRLRRLWTLADTQLLTSGLALEKARRNLALDRPSALDELDTLARLIAIVSEPEPGALLPPGMQLPDKDRPIFLAAVAATANYFVTGDKKHFGAYRGENFGGVIILTPSEFFDARE